MAAGQGENRATPPDDDDEVARVRLLLGNTFLLLECVTQPSAPLCAAALSRGGVRAISKVNVPVHFRCILSHRDTDPHGNVDYLFPWHARPASGTRPSPTLHVFCTYSARISLVFAYAFLHERRFLSTCETERAEYMAEYCTSATALRFEYALSWSAGGLHTTLDTII